MFEANQGGMETLANVNIQPPPLKCLKRTKVGWKLIIVIEVLSWHYLFEANQGGMETYFSPGLSITHSLFEANQGGMETGEWLYTGEQKDMGLKRTKVGWKP